MKNVMKRRASKAGKEPGSLAFIGDASSAPVKIDVIDYDEKEYKFLQNQHVDACKPFLASTTKTWIDIVGVHHTEVIKEIGEKFGIHPLTLEDIVTLTQRPKFDEYDGYLYMVLPILDYTPERGVEIEQVSLVVTPTAVISFQEKPSGIFDVVRKRIEKGGSRIRSSDSDYLAYSLLDAIIDTYFVIFEKVDAHIEILESELVRGPREATLQKIHQFKRNISELRKTVWPLRELVNDFEDSDSDFIKATTRPYLRDAYDHAMYIVDTADGFRESISTMLEIYLSNLNSKTNSIMKVLTIIATIFIPLTFVTSWYGMNFRYMPEFNWKWGYPAVIALMVLITLGMVIYFKRKKWW